MSLFESAADPETFTGLLSRQRLAGDDVVWVPYEIELVLHFFAHASSIDERFPPSPTRDQFVARLVTEGLIAPDRNSRSGYRTTERGDALVLMWKRTPLPVAMFTDPRTNEVVK
jgi:hypothetical protein